MEHLSHILIDSTLDTLKAAPILFLVYLLIEYSEHRYQRDPFHESKLGPFGPLAGAAVGLLPQCGFSAAAAGLYNAKLITAGTLIAVFLSTSDEAIPVMLSHFSSQTADALWSIVLLLAVKFVIAAIAGYFFKYTIFRKEQTIELPQGQQPSTHQHCKHNIFVEALLHTLKIVLFLWITILVIELLVHGIGEERLQTLLLSGSFWQPALTALIGLVPGCATSVFLTELYLSGAIGFGAAIAGLSSGAGFGFLILFRDCKDKKAAAKVLLCTYLAATAAGIILQLFIH